MSDPTHAMPEEQALRLVVEGTMSETGTEFFRALVKNLAVGTLVLTSLALYHWHNPNWIWLTVFIGFNLIQSSFTGFCPSEFVIRKLRGETAAGTRSPSRA